MDKLTSMDAFVRVVDTGSFIRAAEQTGLSRAMVSKHVAALEDRLGVRLLNRTTRRVSVTEAGRAYYQRCQDVLTLVQEAEAEAANLTARPRGTLRINAPVSFGALHVAPALPDFLAQMPDLSVDLIVNDRQVDLLEEGYDMAIRIGTLADSSLIARKLAPCRMVACAAPDYLKRKGEPQAPDDLPDHECIDYIYRVGGRDWTFLKDDKPVSVNIPGTLSVNNGDVAANAAIGGHGIVLQPTFIVGPHLRSGALVPVLTEYPVPELTIAALYPPGRHLPAKTRAFIDFFVARCGDDPYWDEGLNPPTPTP